MQDLWRYKMGIDIRERHNSRLARAASVQGNPRALHCLSREDFLGQAAIVHKANNGMNPVGNACMNSIEYERVTSCPLLRDTRRDPTVMSPFLSPLEDAPREHDDATHMVPDDALVPYDAPSSLDLMQKVVRCRLNCVVSPAGQR